MFTSKCANCTDTVGDGPECSICKKRFHFACGGITERGFARLGSGRASWMCTNCRDAPLTPMETSCIETAAANTPGSSRFSSGLPLEIRAVSTPKHGASSEDKQNFLELLQEVSSKITNIQTEITMIRVIQQDIQQVKLDIAEMNNTLNTKLDKLNNRVDNIESRVSTVEGLVSTIEGLSTEVEDLKMKVKTVLEEGHKNEQWVRRSNIQINGIPHKSGENLIKIIKTLAERSGYPLNAENDIDFITRVAVKNDEDARRSKPIILKMQSRYKKDDFLAALRKLRNIKACDLGFTGMTGRIYFNDHLSQRNKQIFQQAKLKAKEKNYTFCWVKNCTIMVRKTEKSPVLHITSEESLKKIL
ncbi:uncharacterized protein LOC114354964 [Ostrinia furnacalis]|uniref:uncharacterized protein LOC114354964 n=1 Tax=Ostrinia furnacalis TaxID=93504 RepID=UPI00103C5D99|nr:uncharacterized protein LOC114354964 [Ostrinia furnacalis]